MHRCNFFSNVRHDFFAKIPLISFSFDGADYELSMNNGNAIQTSKLLADYAALDPRVQVLGVCFRHWARLCGLDRQIDGTLPSHAFPLLLIHFLQQEKKPVVPCKIFVLCTLDDSAGGAGVGGAIAMHELCAMHHGGAHRHSRRW